jgi:hypothetical protein
VSLRRVHANSETQSTVPPQRHVGETMSDGASYGHYNDTKEAPYVERRYEFGFVECHACVYVHCCEGGSE